MGIGTNTVILIPQAKYLGTREPRGHLAEMLRSSVRHVSNLAGFKPELRLPVHHP